jgi:alcohol dehydrogenase class IV
MSFSGQVFMAPERVVFGRGTVRDIGAYVAQLGGRKPFIATDPIIAATPAFQPLLASLHEQGLPFVLYTGCDVNPTDTQIDRGRDLYVAEGCDVIVGVGGGSNIDTAKSIGIVARNPGSIRDYFVPNYVTNPYGIRNTERIPPTIVVPTTAGTGSEVCCWTVVTNTAENVKGFCGGWTTMPQMAVLDPDLTVSMPPALTAATGFDALMHAIEAYYHRYATPLTDMYALSAIARIVPHLGRAVADGTDMDAREQMLLGAMEAGLAMNTGCALIHSMGLQLTSQFHLSHGETLAIMAGPVMRYNADACPERMADIARAMGWDIGGLSASETALAAADAVQHFATGLGLPTYLDARVHDPAVIPHMAVIAEANDNTRGNPRLPATMAEFEALYHAAYR